MDLFTATKPYVKSVFEYADEYHYTQWLPADMDAEEKQYLSLTFQASDKQKIYKREDYALL